MQIGPRIQTLRRSRGWTQEQLAQALKVSRQAVSKWEAGQAMPDGANLVALSRAFGVSTDSLLLGEESMPDSHAGVRDAQADRNRRIGLLFAYTGQALGLFISLLGLLVIRSQLVSASGFLMQIFSLLGFQLGYKWFPAGVDCGKWRLCYLRGCLWMMAFYLAGSCWGQSGACRPGRTAAGSRLRPSCWHIWRYACRGIGCCAKREKQRGRKWKSERQP